MPGIGMGVKYSWSEPPTFFQMPGEYDYMAGATSYNPKDLSAIEDKVNDIIDNISLVIHNCEINLYSGNDVFSLVTQWNSLFKINGQGQEIVDYQNLTKIGEDTEGSFIEMKNTVDTYFSDATISILSIKEALQKLEDNAFRLANANNNIDCEDEGIREAAKTYIASVKDNGTEYNLSMLQKIGKWVY